MTSPVLGGLYKAAYLQKTASLMRPECTLVGGFLIPLKSLRPCDCIFFAISAQERPLALVVDRMVQAACFRVPATKSTV